MGMTYNDNCLDSEDAIVEEFTDHLLDHIKEVSKQLETEGYKGLDYYASDDYVDEALISIEYEFKEDGTIS